MRRLPVVFAAAVPTALSFASPSAQAPTDTTSWADEYKRILKLFEENLRIVTSVHQPIGTSR